MITEKEILALADSMAAAASDLNAMNYDALINSRADLVNGLKVLFENLK